MGVFACIRGHGPICQRERKPESERQSERQGGGFNRPLYSLKGVEALGGIWLCLGLLCVSS